MPPRRAMAMAIRDSVTVSMALDTQRHGAPRSRGSGARSVSTSLGMTSVSPGSSSTSSKVRPRAANGAGTSAGRRSSRQFYGLATRALRPRTGGAGTAQRTRARPVGQVLTAAVRFERPRPRVAAGCSDEHRSVPAPGRPGPACAGSRPGPAAQREWYSSAHQLAHPAAPAGSPKEAPLAEISRLPGPVADLWDWQLDGSCRRENPDVFFHPEGERGPARRNRDRPPRRSASPARCSQQCREHALRVREPYGVWGAMTADEREASYAAAS